MKIFIVLIIVCKYSFVNCQETLPLTESEKLFSEKVNLKYETDSPSSYLIYRGFVVKYNYLAKSPEYTIHRLTFDQLDGTGKVIAKRRSTFWVDENQLNGQSSLNIDFKGSGYDRGHMVPAGDFVWEQLLKSETFTLSNICAQTPQLNRGIWNQLEQKIRNNVLALKDTGYVITGAIYDNHVTHKIGMDSVWIAKYFYKLVYLINQNKMFAYLFPHDVNNYSSELSTFQLCVDDIERILNEDFFERLSDPIESNLESEINILE